LLFLKTFLEDLENEYVRNTFFWIFTKEGWKNILSKFAMRTGLSYNHKQLKNMWDSLKKDFGIWAKLIEHQTGLGWDPIKRTVLASDDWWERKGQVSM